MVRQFVRWLGPERVRLLIVLLIVTGLSSLVLAAFAGDESWSVTLQTLLALSFLGVATLIIGSRMNGASRQRLFLTVGPALGLAALSGLLPDYSMVILGMAFGWLLVAQFLIRENMQPEYRTAVKHLRKQEYKEAIDAISGLIKREPKDPQHLRFRAELHRLSGHLGAATKDYDKVRRLAPDAPEGYNGLAEVYLQKGEFQQAHEYALQAYQCEPDYWVAPYNLGMIEDRLGDNNGAIEHLTVVLEKGLPDSRHRLLTYLWLARAHYRLDDVAAANQNLKRMQREGKGLKEWQMILADEQSTTVRKVLEADVRLAERVLENDVSAEELFGDV